MEVTINQKGSPLHSDGIQNQIQAPYDGQPLQEPLEERGHSLPHDQGGNKTNEAEHLLRMIFDQCRQTQNLLNHSESLLPRGAGFSNNRLRLLSDAHYQSGMLVNMLLAHEEAILRQLRKSKS